MKGYTRIEELMASLTNAMEQLGQGKLKLEGLDSSVEGARELYERLVVLRHKAREATLTSGRASAAVPAPETPAPSAVVAEPQAIPLATMPPEVAPRQTSLIEAIEEAVTDEPKPAKNNPTGSKAPASNTRPTPSVADKLENAPIADLGKAIALSQKFWFVAELFHGDRIGFDKAIDTLNAMNDRKEAMGFVEKNVVARLKANADPEALAKFTDLIERRFA